MYVAFISLHCITVVCDEYYRTDVTVLSVLPCLIEIQDLPLVEISLTSYHVKHCAEVKGVIQQGF